MADDTKKDDPHKELKQKIADAEAEHEGLRRKFAGLTDLQADLRASQRVLTELHNKLFEAQNAPTSDDAT